MLPLDLAQRPPGGVHAGLAPWTPEKYRQFGLRDLGSQFVLTYRTNLAYQLPSAPTGPLN